VPVTLITGGSTGIGAATARLLLDAGHQVVVTARTEQRLAELQAATGAGDKLLALPGDASVDEDVRGWVARTVEHFGALDNVVANAGYSTHDTLDDGDPQRWREMLLANVLGPMLLIHEALPHLRAGTRAGRTPRIVLVGSVAGLRNAPGNVYSVTKWAVHALAENTRLLVTGDGVGVTLIAPGRVDTPFWDEKGGVAAVGGPSIGADDIARTIAFALTQPASVDVNTLVVRPVGQVI
jgi:NADP-dependent 3-hydroxy acid dehydrogenase YdfG